MPEKAVFLSLFMLALAMSVDCSTETEQWPNSLCTNDSNARPNVTAVNDSNTLCSNWSNAGYCMLESIYFCYVYTECENICSPKAPRSEIPKPGSAEEERCRELKVLCDFRGMFTETLKKQKCDFICKQKNVEEEAIVPVQVIESDECGLTSFTSFTQRIVGGFPAERGSFPWQVSLIYGLYAPRHRCGGVLIGRKHILSAAHCIVGNLNLYKGVLGNHQKSGETEITKKTVSFSKIVKHEGYNQRTMENDISILTMKEEIIYTNYIRPICLPSEPPIGKEDITVSGWGATKDPKVSSNVLRKVTVPLVETKVCNGTGYKTYRKLKKGMFCAGFDIGGKDACQGDSGGPAVLIREGRFELAGIVSWGYGCAGRMSPGIYADVYYYLDWIQRKRETNEEEKVETD